MRKSRYMRMRLMCLCPVKMAMTAGRSFTASMSCSALATMPPGTKSACGFVLGEDPGVNEQDERTAVVVSSCGGFAQDAVVCFCPCAQTVFQWADGIHVGECKTQTRRGFDDVQGFWDGKLSGKSLKAPFLGVAVVIARDVVCGRGEGRQMRFWLRLWFASKYHKAFQMRHLRRPRQPPCTMKSALQALMAGVIARCISWLRVSILGRAEVFFGCSVVMAVCDKDKV